MDDRTHTDEVDLLRLQLAIAIEEQAKAALEALEAKTALQRELVAKAGAMRAQTAIGISQKYGGHAIAEDGKILRPEAKTS